MTADNEDSLLSSVAQQAGSIRAVCLRAEQQAEATLREQASLLNLTYDAIFVRDMNGTVKYWNRGAEELYGWPAEQAVGRVSQELLKTIFPVSLEQIQEEVIGAGRWEGELLQTKKDGSQVVVSSRLSLQNDERNEPVAIIVINNDITKRRRAEEIALRSEKELRDVVNAVPAFVWTTLPDGAVDFVNEHWLEFTGLSPQDALGWNWEAALHPDDRSRAVADWRAALKNEQSVEGEIRVRRVDGEFRWWFFRSMPLHDESGNIVKWYGTGVDIEERKRAELERRRLASLVEQAADLMAIADLSGGTPIYLNTAGLKLVGFDSWEEARARRGIHYYFSEDRQFVNEVLWPTVLEKGSWSGEVRFRHFKTGDPIAVLYSAFRFDDPETGQPVNVGVVCRDITERKRAEAEARENDRRYREMQMELAHANRVATVGQLTASIAHEVNQPIAATVTNAQAALRWLHAGSSRLEKVQQSLTSIVEDGTRAGEVIDRIRALIKKAPPRKDRLDVNGMILEIIEITRGEALKNGISVLTELADHLPVVEADRVQLQQVLLNLIVNALDAMTAPNVGPRQLLISTGKGETSGVLVAVQDSGPGLEAAMLERVFESFYTTKPTGLGLGLSICRSIIEAHGGRLWASTNQRRGATFQFTLPRDEKIPS
jgi:PAS domain S-box-containing protein